MIVGGVLAALVGAVVLSFGAQLQNRGVQASGHGDGSTGLGVRQALGLFRSRGWLLGSGLLTLAVLLQLVALLLAPLPVVQPLGVLSLVVTALLGRRLAGTRLQRRAVQGIALSVVGVSGFVVAAALTTRSSPDEAAAVVPVLVLVGAVLAVLLPAYLLLRRRRVPGVVWALAGGGCFGFVVTLMKVVLDRSGAAVQRGGLVDPSTPFTLLVLVAAGAVGLAGISLVQAAYTSGSADLVVAALTVIDPLVAVTVGVGLLGEARGAPPWVPAVFLVAGAVAATGVVLMARHPSVPIDR